MDIEQRLERLEAFDIPNQNLDTNSDVQFDRIITTNYLTGTYYYNGTYTPTWTALTSGTSIGNGTLVGLYRVIGNTCHVAVQLDIGSTTNEGMGIWEFTLPVTPSSRNARFPVGPAFALDSGNADYACICRLDVTSGKVRILTTDRTTGAGCSSTVPFLWNTGDVLTWSLTYEV